MRLQITTILLSLAFLAVFCPQTNALPQLEFPSSFRKNLIMNAHATSSGRVELKKDSSTSTGFYVDADFSSSEASKTSSNSAISDAVKMMISIANEDTLVASDCLGFDPYDCGRYSCSNSTITSNIDFPTFAVNGATQIKSSIYLDYQYWSIDTSYFYIADSCKSGDTSSGIGKNRSGVLGLGTSPLSKHYYSHPPLFSILIDSNLTGGELLFKKDSNYTQSSPLYTFYASSTWQIPTDSNAYIKISTYENSTVSLGNLNVMFDVNSDAIGLPEALFNAFFSDFLQVLNLWWCYPENYRPYCYSPQLFEDLPDIILSLNHSQIIIPSKVYATYRMTQGNKTFFYLNFKATSPSLTGKNYVTPSFKNSIILDANFMSYYYTVFDGTNVDNMISLYSLTSNSDQPSDAKWLIYAALGVFLLVGVAGVCYWAKKRRDNNKKGAAATITTTTNGFNTTQTPLIHNDAYVAANSRKERAKP